MTHYNILFLHGAGSWGGGAAFAAALHDTAYAASRPTDEFNFITPDGRATATFLGKGWDDSKSQDEEILSLVPSDEHVLIVGHSNGGFYGLKLLLTYPHIFGRGVFLGSGLMARHVDLLSRAQRSGGPNPTLHVWGSSDDVIKLHGGLTPTDKNFFASLEPYLGPLHTVQALAAIDVADSTEKLDLIDPQGRVESWLAHGRFAGAETTYHKFGNHGLMVIDKGEHADLLGKSACFKLYDWLCQ